MGKWPNDLRALLSPDPIRILANSKKKRFSVIYTLLSLCRDGEVIRTLDTGVLVLPRCGACMIEIISV